METHQSSAVNPTIDEILESGGPNPGNTVLLTAFPITPSLERAPGAFFDHRDKHVGAQRMGGPLAASHDTGYQGQRHERSGAWSILPYVAQR